MAFVNLDAGAPSLSEFLGEIPAEVEAAGFRLSELVPFERRDYTLAANWKVYVDNYLEGYHVPIAHPGLYRAIDYDRYEVVPRRFHSAQYAPLRSGDATRRMLGRDRRYLRSDDEERALYYWIFPNLMLNLYADNLQLNAILPLGLDRTLTIFEWFVHPDLSAGEARAAARVDRVQRRDPARGHRGVRGGAARAALARLRRRTVLGQARERRTPLPSAAPRISVAPPRDGCVAPAAAHARDAPSSGRNRRVLGVGEVMRFERWTSIRACPGLDVLASPGASSAPAQPLPQSREFQINAYTPLNQSRQRSPPTAKALRRGVGAVRCHPHAGRHRRLAASTAPAPVWAPTFRSTCSPRAYSAARGWRAARRAVSW